MLASKKSRLPPEYQEVEWIKATGTQYIETDIRVESSMTAYFKVARIGDASRFLINNYANNAQRFIIPAYLNGYWSADIGGNQWTACNLGSSGEAEPVEITIEANSSGFKATRLGYGTRTIQVRNTAAGYLNIFKYPILGPVYPGMLWIIQLTMSASKYEIIPTYRKIDNKTGIFETVNQKFYPCLGGQEFELGPDVN